MPRTAAVAHTYVVNLNIQFARQQYRIVTDQQAGKSVCDEPNDIVYFLRMLALNEIYTGLLSDNQRDSYIDYCQRLLL